MDETTKGAEDFGPFLVQRNTVYALTEKRMSATRSKMVEVNSFSALVQPGHGCTDGQAEAIAQLLGRAPQLAAALRLCCAEIAMLHGDDATARGESSAYRFAQDTLKSLDKPAAAG